MSDELRRFLDLGRAIRADLDKMGISQPKAEVPEALRYILFRYGQDHTGEDHQARLRVAAEWLARMTALVIPPGPLVELTPARVEALKSLLALAEVEAQSYSGIVRAGIEAGAVTVEAMLDEVLPRN